ncbi:T-cell surface glycoprotein CD3 gamma chain-like [Mixophyes fleayi]|uniref:T-cell surface glycoprotein CD3 gamma chain-like n=1 Tax=Mixophyes fleayi TaxID=3061075 RepID=UPI003F4E3CC8
MAYPVTVLSWLIYILLVRSASTQEGTNVKNIVGTEKGDKLFLKCPFQNYIWEKDGHDLPAFNDKDLDLGSLWNDPRGVYSCRETKTESNTETKKPQYIHVHVRKCQNCIELDAGTISGFLVADVIMIGLIAMAVYFVSGMETRRPGRASDKQHLIEMDGGYQQLRHRQADLYSHLGTQK